MNALESIAQAEFIATDEQVVQLARIAAEGRQAGGTYLKVLFAYAKAAILKKRKPSRKVQLQVIDKIHARLYALVLIGVGVNDLEAHERNRRATFARTATSTLRYFVKRGRRSVVSLDVASVTKNKLRALSGIVPAGTRTERVLDRTADAFLRNARRLAKGDPTMARRRIATLQTQLAKVLATIPGKRKSVTVRPRAHTSVELRA